MDANVHSIETFGSVDGPGIRLVVFLQGCPMRCAYCHNPDTWKQTGGTKMSAQAILELYQRNKAFYEKGGLTVSGGEPLLQIDFLIELFTLAKKQAIHTALDTSGITFDENHHQKIDELMIQTDLVLLDLKQINPQRHQSLTTHSNQNILNFARYLNRMNKEVWVRHVYINQAYESDQDLTDLGHFIAPLRNITHLDILPYHTMGNVKYTQLGIVNPMQDHEPTSKTAALHAKQIILKAIKELRK